MGAPGAILKELRATCPQITVLHVLSDGPVTQFRNKANFYFLSTVPFFLGSSMLHGTIQKSPMERVSRVATYHRNAISKSWKSEISPLANCFQCCNVICDLFPLDNVAWCSISLSSLSIFGKKTFLEDKIIDLYNLFLSVMGMTDALSIYSTTSDLELFQNHILMYAGRRFAYIQPTAAIDYNHHNHRPAARNSEGDEM